MSLGPSFVPRAGWSLPWALGAVACTSALMLVMLIGLILATWRLRADSEMLVDWLASHPQTAAAANVHAPDLAMLQALRAEASRINRITGVHGRPLPSVLRQIEQVLPDSARLRELRYRHRGGELSLTAELNSAEELSGLLRRLEADDAYAKVLLVRQSRHSRADGAPGLLVELRLTEAGAGG